MKKLLLLLAVVFAVSACSSSDDENVTGDENAEGTLFFKSVDTYTLQSGEEKERPLDIHLLYIWNADGKDYDMYSNSVDILGGYLYDRNTNTSEESIRWAGKVSSFNTKLDPGKYVIVVYYPSGNKSYTYFDIEEGKVTDLKKYLKHRVPGESYSEW